MNSIRNTATGLLVVAYGDLKDRAAIDCAYMNKTELKYGRPAIFEVATDTAPQPMPAAPAFGGLKDEVAPLTAEVAARSTT